MLSCSQTTPGKGQNTRRMGRVSLAMFNRETDFTRCVSEWHHQAFNPPLRTAVVQSVFVSLRVLRVFVATSFAFSAYCDNRETSPTGSEECSMEAR